MRVASSLDKAGTDQHCQMIWVRRARRKGVREEPVTERFSRRPTSSNLIDMGWVAMRIGVIAPRTPWPIDIVGREAMVNACGVAMARLQEHNWAPTPSKGSRVNVGTIPAVPSPANALLQAERPVAGSCRWNGTEDT